MASSADYSAEHLFNTPLEVGLRCLILLAESNRPCDLHRLKIYDYFLLHSNDVQGGPDSLHPPSPFRTSELLVRHSLIKNAVRLLMAKGLVVPLCTSHGFQFKSTELAGPFLSHFESEYATRARRIAQWVDETFGLLDDAALQTFVNDNVGKWGTEFTVEPLLEEEGD
jgi:hypothetical protein